MTLNPNNYKYIIDTVKRGASNFPYKPLIIICNEIAIVNHIPILAILLLAQKYVDSSNELEYDIKSMKEFYKYDQIEPVY